MDKEIRIEIRDLLGTASPFKQGGSLRIVLPKRITRLYNIERRPSGEIGDVTFFFIATNIGVLMCSLSELSKNPPLSESILSHSTRSQGPRESNPVRVS